jgi:hydroxyacyl-ACP dehydratase HTD2-like protein with hotdog domain
MPTTFAVGDVLPPLTEHVTAFRLFRYSAVTWNPHRIHFDEHHAREEGHLGLALHSHLRAALALRGATEGLGGEYRIETFAYRLRKPLYAPTDVTYHGRIAAVDGDELTVELVESTVDGDVGFEGTVTARRVPVLAGAGARP